MWKDCNLESVVCLENESVLKVFNSMKNFTISKFLRQNFDSVYNYRKKFQISSLFVVRRSPWCPKCNGWFIKTINWNQQTQHKSSISTHTFCVLSTLSIHWPIYFSVTLFQYCFFCCFDCPCCLLLSHGCFLWMTVAYLSRRWFNLTDYASCKMEECLHDA